MWYVRFYHYKINGLKDIECVDGGFDSYDDAIEYGEDVSQICENSCHFDVIFKEA